MVKSRSAINRDWLLSHPNYRRGYNAKIRRQVLEHYSSGDVKCACCSESHYEFLCIDHINGGGTKQRKSIGYGGGLWQWLRSHHYPLGYRVLCCNCNFALGHSNYCPHQEEEA